MKEDFEKIKKWVEGLFGHVSTRSISYTRKGIMPQRDWFFMLVASVLVACVIAGWSYYIYEQVDAGTLYDITSTDSTSVQIVIDASLLKKTIDAFDARQATADDLTHSTSTPPDPSL